MDSHNTHVVLGAFTAVERCTWRDAFSFARPINLAFYEKGSSFLLSSPCHMARCFCGKPIKEICRMCSFQILRQKVENDGCGVVRITAVSCGLSVCGCCESVRHDCVFCHDDVKNSILVREERKT
jgi:hypothetical protein